MYQLEEKQRRKVIIEKFSIYDRRRISIFLRGKKMEYSMKQQYGLAAFYRQIERCIELDYNIVEDYIFLLSAGTINLTEDNIEQWKNETLCHMFPKF